MDAVVLPPHRLRPTSRVRALLIVVALVLFSVAPDRAAAHAALVRSDPADGASLSAAPNAVTLTFDVAIGRPAYAVVTAPDGTRVEVGDAEPLDATVTQRLDPSVAQEQAGRWTVAFRVVSVDGHPVSDQLSFTVEGDAGSKQAAAASASASAAADDEQPFWRVHAGYLTLGAGGLLVVALLLWWPAGRRRDA